MFESLMTMMTLVFGYPNSINENIYLMQTKQKRWSQSNLNLQ